MGINFKRYILYLFRWQLSTPILAIVLIWLASINKWIATIIANLIGGLIFFWVDQYIFTSQTLQSQWEVKENIACKDCGKIARGYRLVKSKNYDRTKSLPEFRCESCSAKKSHELRKEGIEIS
jgi:DNA-directed RNA polymerase subunit RPC12/RpoP